MGFVLPPRIFWTLALLNPTRFASSSRVTDDAADLNISHQSVLRYGAELWFSPLWFVM